MPEVQNLELEPVFVVILVEESVLAYRPKRLTENAWRIVIVPSERLKVEEASFDGARPKF